MALEYCVVFPVAKRGTMLNLFGAAIYSDPIRDFTKARFLRSAFSTTVIPVPTEAPEATTQETITMDQVIDPLVTDLHWNVLAAHKACNLFRTPMLLQSFSYPVRQPLHPFVTLEGGSTPGVCLMLSPLGLVASNAVPSQLAADRAVVAAKHCCDLSLAFAGHTQGRNLVSLCSGQLSVLHHCFTLVGKAREGTGDGPPASTWLRQNAAVII